MALISKSNLASGGIDRWHARRSIPEGSAEDLVNVRAHPSGKIEKRTGYEGYLGWMPWSASKVEHSGTKLRFRLGTAEAIDLSSVREGPIAVRVSGVSGESGDFGTGSTTIWYPSFDLASRETLTVPSGTIEKTADDHGQDSRYFFGYVAISTSSLEKDNQTLALDYFDILQSDLSIDMDYFATSADTAFVVLRDGDTVSGQRYVWDPTLISDTFTVNTGTDYITLSSQQYASGRAVQFTTTGTLPAPLEADKLYWVINASTSFQVSETYGGSAVDITDTGSGTHTAKLATYALAPSVHGLETTDFVVKAVEDTGTEDREITLDHLWTTDDGYVYVTALGFSNPYFIVESTSNAQSLSASSGSNSFTISSPGSAYNFVQLFKFDGTNTRWEAVGAQDITYDESADELTISYTTLAAETMKAVWVTGTAIANEIEVDDSNSTSATWSSETAQITVWGIDHQGVYYSSATRGGYVSGLELYRKTGEDPYLVSALGGNLFREGLYADYSSTYQMAKLYANLDTRVNADTKIAPLFHSSDPGSVRDRGVIYDALVDSSNRAKVTAASYVSSGVVDYTLTFTSKTGTLALGTQVSASDYLTVSGMANSQHNGTFQISAVTDNGATEVVIRVSNSSVTSDVYDETGAAGRAGVFSDLIVTSEFQGDHLILAGDTVSSPAGDSWTVLSIDTTNKDYMYVSGVTEAVSLNEGDLLAATRSTSLIPMRDLDRTSTIEGFVPGDMLVVSGLDRRVRIKAARSRSANNEVTVVVSSGTATVTESADHELNVGDKVLIVESQAGGPVGEFTVVSSPTSLSFTFATDADDGSYLAQWAANTIEIDETLSVSGGSSATSFQNEGRWIPLSAPGSSDDSPASSYNRYLDKEGLTSQKRLRSASLKDSLYISQQEDEVFKYDGSSLYWAGLPSFNPYLFSYLNTDTASIPAGKIIASSSVSYDDNGKWMETDKVTLLEPGDRVYNASSAEIYTVTKIDTYNNGTKDLFRVFFNSDADLSSASGNLLGVSVYKYFFRFSYLDSNKRLVASAVFGVEDAVFEMTQSGQIVHRMMGMPDYGPLDFDLIEYEVYRTLAGGAVYYFHSRGQVSFDKASPYFEIFDGISDDLIQGRLDPLSGIYGTELPTDWERPPRAKALSSAGGRLLAANIKGDFRLDLSFKPKIGNTQITAANIAGTKLTFSLDGSQDYSATATNPLTHFKYEFVNSGAVNFAPNSAIDNSNAGYFEVTSTAHGLEVGDWVYFFHLTGATDTLTNFSGWHQIIAKTTDTFQCANDNTTAVSADEADRYVTATDPKDIPVYIGTDFNWKQRDGQPAGTDVEAQITARLAAAINATQRATNKAITGQETFEPWLLAKAGNVWPRGFVRVEVPRAVSTTPELVDEGSDAGVNFELFCNDTRLTTGGSASFVQPTFPSRVARSILEYPEIFKAPLETGPGDDVIDVNAEDGQEIVALLPLFGESASSSSQLSSEQVVLKENSVYLLNPETKEYLRVNSEGQGCEAAFSPAYTHDGIIFANRNGLFKLDRGRKVTRLKKLEGFWEEITQDSISEAAGGQDTRYGRYVCAVPRASTSNTDLIVVEYQRERTEGLPEAISFGRTFKATKFREKQGDLFFASTEGDVFKSRNRGEASDYRDEDQAISSTILLRPEDFGVAGVRKAVSKIFAQLELPDTDLTSFSTAIAWNLEESFSSAGSVSQARSDNVAETFKFSLPQRRGWQIQLRFTHSTKDEGFTLTGVAYEVKGLTPGKLIPES